MPDFLEEQLSIIKDMETLINLLIIEKEKRHQYHGDLTRYESDLRNSIEILREKLSKYNIR